MKVRHQDKEVEICSVPSTLVGNELSDAIAQLIAEAAEELGTEPQSITLADLKKYAKKQDLGLKAQDISRAGGFAIIRDAYFPPKPTKPAVETQRLKEQARFYRKLNNESVKLSYMTQTIEEYASKVFAGRVAPYAPRSKFHSKPTQRVINAVWSDHHYGSDISAVETGRHTYGSLEESRRLAACVDQILSYKIEHRDNTELHLSILGDMIQNQLHDQRDGAEFADQVCRAVHVLSQAIAHLSAGFKKVTVHCTSGNHGRNMARHLERAVNQKWDSVETIIYYSLKQACKQLKNVSFDIPKTPFFVYEVFGKKIFGTHGDTVLKPGYPGRSINVAGLEHQINKFNASLSDKDEYSVAIMGHVHVASMTHLANGAVIITNGALVPPDEYAISLGQFETQCGQWVFESVPGFPVGDARLIRVDESHDRNPKLDQIIRPWSGL